MVLPRAWGWALHPPLEYLDTEREYWGPPFVYNLDKCYPLISISTYPTLCPFHVLTHYYYYYYYYYPLPNLITFLGGRVARGKENWGGV